VLSFHGPLISASSLSETMRDHDQHHGPIKTGKPASETAEPVSKAVVLASDKK
jgi:hypothetical protein